MSHKRLREDIFVYDDSVQRDSIPNNLVWLRIDSSVKRIPPNTFYCQTDLKRVEYEEGLEVIGREAFSYCTSLREQQFPSTLVEVGHKSFSWCQRLESVGQLPHSLTLVREEAFAFCFALKSFEITNDKLHFEEGVFRNCANLSHVGLPRAMVTIPNTLFLECESLVHVNVPTSVIEIGYSAFDGCSKLSELDLPLGLKVIGDQVFYNTRFQHFDYPANIERTGTGALKECSDLASVGLPPKLKIIDRGTFYNCENLKRIKIPDSVVQIDTIAFKGCGLTQLDLSRLNMTRIQAGAFRQCVNLRNVELPRTGLKEIEMDTFEHCRSLTHLWIPPTVEFMHKGSFAWCTSLLSVEVPETLKSLEFLDGEEVRGYRSLVNIYLPPSHQLDELEDYHSMEEMKLGEAEGNYLELVDKLKRRFDSLPLHRLCYFQSYHSLHENIKRIQSVVTADTDGATMAIEKVDFLGMTPFHILALSHHPSLNLFQELVAMDKSSASDIILNRRDTFGSTPLDYLCQNIYSTEARNVTKSLLVQILERRISFLGLDCWRKDLWLALDQLPVSSSPSPAMNEEEEPLSLASNLTLILQELADYERLEVLSLLEMKIWKLKMLEATLGGNKTINDDDRENCRVNCGSRIILENVIPFLGSHNQ